jgi:6-phosphofructokinase 1
MGRHCGDLALHTGLAGGIEVILVPERSMTTEEIIGKLNKSRETGKMSGIVLIAEGVGDADKLTEELNKHFTTRLSVLGYLQRGGAPSRFDRLFGTQAGIAAVRLLMAGKGGRVVGIKENKIFDMDIHKALSMKKVFNQDLYDMAMAVSR